MFFSVSRALRKARHLAMKGEFDLAEKKYQGILEKHPDNTQAIEGLAALELEKAGAPAGNPGPAQEQINELVSLCDQGQFHEVLARGEALARRFPDMPFFPNLLGAANFNIGRPEQAEGCFREALEISPDFAQAHNNLGNVLNVLGRPEEAAASFERALRIRPDFVEALSNLAIVLNVLGRREEAADSCNRALQIRPDMAEVHWNLSLVKKYRDGDAQINQMLLLAARPDLSDSDRMYLGFALGKAFEDLGDQDKAYSYLVEANRLRKEELKYDISSDRALLAKIKSIFSEKIPAPDIADETESVNLKRPVFIVGMPRSGTSLIEQILASHSEVYGAGELSLLEQLVGRIEWNSWRLTAEQLQYVRDSYLSGLAKIGASETYITDKMPRNFQWIGFICAAMPEAKIIHVRRDARATCWSNFKTCFSENGIGFAYDLQDVAEYYKMYTNLMVFWHEKFPDRIYDLSYEELTENQEEETGKLLEYIGLEWEEQCLAFHETRRAVRTASAAQVRNKMFQGSSEEWRKYERHLGIMIELLKEY